MHQNIVNKNYDMVGTYLTNNIIFSLGDGSGLERKETCVKFILESYSSIKI